MVSLPAVVRTRRLRLRPPTLADAQPVFDAYASDPVVTRYLAWRTHSTTEDTAQWLSQGIAAWDAVASGTTASRPVPWLVEKQDDQRVVGSVSVAFGSGAPRPHGPRDAVVGYALTRSEWGNGFASEAVGAMLRCLLDDGQLAQVWSMCDVDNRASARVLEKVGMRYHGVLASWTARANGASSPRDVHCYVLP